jgi:hypothetical protein
MPTTLTAESYGPDRTNPVKPPQDAGRFRDRRPGERTLAQASGPPPGETYASVVSTFLTIVIVAISVFTAAVVAWALIWAAKKDGEEDRAVQKRLGIRRRTRLGR